jgi:hypothetical protein
MWNLNILIINVNAKTIDVFDPSNPYIHHSLCRFYVVHFSMRHFDLVLRSL